jgi:dienelactone hydrolase
MKTHHTGPRDSRRTFLKQTLAAGLTAASSLSRCLAGEGARATTVHEDIARAMKKAELSMLYRGDTAEECRAWQKAFRAKLNELLGDSTPPKKWDVQQESRVALKDHVRFELLLRADGVPSVPVYLLIPNGIARGTRVPGVVCVHGHGAFGNDPIVGRTDKEGVAEAIKHSNYDYGLQFVRRGYVVAAPCMIPFGRRVERAKYGGNDPCAVTFVRMMALGKLPITANLRDLRWTIDLLQSRSEVNPERIGCAGLSYGGRMTMMVSAVDERVRVAAVSGALNLLQERTTLRYSCGSQIIPGLLKYGDYSEIGSLIAPRPCVWETGSKDALIVPKWDDLFRARLRRAYTSLKAGDQLHFDRFEGGHQWSGRIALPVFDRVLKS